MPRPRPQAEGGHVAGHVGPDELVQGAGASRGGSAGGAVVQKQLARLPKRRELAGTVLSIIFAMMMLTTLSLPFFLDSGTS